MEPNVKVETSTIDANDIIIVMSQNNIKNKIQIKLLKVIHFVLFKKQYPKDICGIIERKIQLLDQKSNKKEKDISNTASMKVRSAIIMEMLKQMKLGTNLNDLTKICLFIAFLTGCSYKKIYNEMQKGIYLSKFHNQQIEEANKLLIGINSSITINKGKRY